MFVGGSNIEVRIGCRTSRTHDHRVKIHQGVTRTGGTATKPVVRKNGLDHTYYTTVAAHTIVSRCLSRWLNCFPADLEHSECVLVVPILKYMLGCSKRCE